MKVIAQTLYQEAEFTMTDAKELSPVDTGALRASGFVEPPDKITSSTRTIIVTLGFGGVAGSGNLGGLSNDSDVGYAVYVHEDCSKRYTVGGCKYLEIPVNAAQRTIPKSIIRNMKRMHRTKMARKT